MSLADADSASLVSKESVGSDTISSLHLEAYSMGNARKCCSITASGRTFSLLY